MTINEIITKHYDKLHSLITNPDVPIYDSLTMEDIFQNVIITAMNKYKDKDIEENEGQSYLEKTLKTEFHFSYRRKGKDKIIYVDNINTYDDLEDE